ncbi:MAG: hypothetical protein WC975_03610 [Phycisphaerae bacterium]
MKDNLFFSRFFSEGPVLVVAVDHGLFDGPVPGVHQVNKIAENIHPDIDAVLVSPGMFRHLKEDLFGKRHCPQPIVRINWSSIYCFSWDYHAGDTVTTYQPMDLLKMGVPVVLISLSLRTGSEARDAENVKIFADLCRQAHDLGMMVIGEYFPVNDEKLNVDEMHEEIKIGCRILFELGADVIKTFHTRDFDKVAQGCPIPILTLGGKRAPSDLAALEMAEIQIKSGAAGIVFGRNVFQSPKPIALQKAILDVLKNNVSARQAAKKHGLK